MIPSQQIMYDCDFRDASDIPKTVNFMMALGEAVYSIDMDDIKKFNEKEFFEQIISLV